MVKKPNQRAKGQLFTNLKLFCTSTKVANTLILVSGHISHLGSQIQFTKDVRRPSTCNWCQQYGHTAQKCKPPSPVCAKCREHHFSSECWAQTTVCTPCGSNDHVTNDNKCPKWIEHVNAMRAKKPELLTLYFITTECWTWGLITDDTTPQESSNESMHHHQHQQCKPLRSSPHQRQTNQMNKDPERTQCTLLKSGFQRCPTQTGANSIPVKPKNTPNNVPSPSPWLQVRLLPTQHTNTLNSKLPPQSTTSLQWIWHPMWNTPGSGNRTLPNQAQHNTTYLLKPIPRIGISLLFRSHIWTT